MSEAAIVEIIDPESTPAMRSLRGMVCPLCGGSKAACRTFCDTCAMAVGLSVRAMLCVAADAYPAAFGRAFEALGKEPKILDGEKR